MTTDAIDTIYRLRGLLTTATPGPWNYIEAKTLIHLESDANGEAICSFAKSKLKDADLIYRTINALPMLLDLAERQAERDAGEG